MFFKNVPFFALFALLRKKFAKKNNIFNNSTKKKELYADFKFLEVVLKIAPN
jgi:hypothetical protein